jgi:nitroreductase
MDALEALLTRTSVGALVEPGPTDAQLDAILRAASRAPDHGRMRPWRFLLIRGEARERFGEVLALSLRRADPSATDALLERERRKPLRAPAILVVAVTPQSRPGVPEIEQILAGGAAAQNVLLAAHAQGLGAMWRTGERAYDDDVKQALGLPAAAAIIGFIYVGTPAPDVRPRPVEPSAAVVEWTGAPTGP